MRDQPFKRYFPSSDKKLPKQNYKYPTYQHYYKVSELNFAPIAKPIQPQQKLEDTFKSPIKKTSQILQISPKKDNNSNLKNQLQHLKNEVYKIMEKKQGILRGSIDKKTAERQREVEVTPNQESDSQSVSSDKIFGETMRKLELKKVPENYDYSKYIELENNLLKTELRTLKNKYISKKKELTEKCSGLEQKVTFLENALCKSEEALVNEVATLKQALQEAQNIEKQQLIPTSDKEGIDNQQIVEQLQNKILELQRLNEELQKKCQAAQYFSNFQDMINQLKAEYQNKLISLEKQKENIIDNFEQQLISEQDKANSYQQQCTLQQSKIDNLSRRLQGEINKNQQAQQYYIKTIELAEREHRELVKSLQKQFTAKLLASPKKQCKQRDSPLSQSPSKKELSELQNMRNELKRWKVQYKLLKQRHESYMKVENESQSQIKGYYREYRQLKQNLEVYSQKNKLLETQFEKYMKILIQKDAQIIKKELEVVRIGNEAELQKSNNMREINALKDRCRNLEERLNEQVQKNEKDTAFRHDLEQKLFASIVTDETIKETLDRTKKRMLEQDEKLSKNVKELKNKESLISKLKQELRELMENVDVKQEQRKIEIVNQLVESHLKNESTALQGLRSRVQQEKVFMEEQLIKFLEEIENLKLQNYTINRKMIDLTNQVKLIAHSYNTKTLELSTLLQKREQEIQNLEQKLQEVQISSNGLQVSLKEELNFRNEEISLLRKEVLSKHSTIGTQLSGTFDEILRAQIEGNNKLREQSLKKADQIYKMRDTFTSLRSQYDNIKSQNDINKLKFLSKRKNMEIGFQSEIQNYKNIIDSWEKKVISFEQKMKIFIEENKKKDQFIQNFIIGKKISQNQKEILADFMKQYEIALEGKDIVDRLMTESKTIENLHKYNENLLKEVAELKEKLILFEAIDVDKISLYSSKISRQQSKSIEQHQSPEHEQESKLKKTISLQDFTVIQGQI